MKAVLTLRLPPALMYVPALITCLTKWTARRSSAGIGTRAAGILVIAIVPGAFAVWLAYRILRAGAARRRRPQFAGSPSADRNDLEFDPFDVRPHQAHA